MDLNSCVCGMKIYFILIPTGMKILNFSPQETYDFQILGNETSIIVGCGDIKISIFHKLAVELWQKEDNDLHRNNP